MKIAISGAHSQGKTTLVEALQQCKEFKGFNFKTNLTRNINKSGAAINELGTELTQIRIMAKHHEFLCEDGDAILDRCALDGLAYTMYFYDKISDDMKKVFERWFEEMIYKYDAICYILPELPLKEDGTRSINRDFFEKVKNNFNDIIVKYNLTVYYISGSVEERVQQIKDVYEDLKISKLIPTI